MHTLPHAEEEVSHGMEMPARGVCRTLVALIMLQGHPWLTPRPRGHIPGLSRVSRL